MRFYWLQKLTAWRPGSVISDRWWRMRYFGSTLLMRWRIFWTLGDRGTWFFFGGLGLVFVTLAALVYHAVEDKVADADLTCLARNIYYEARGEPAKGQRAVAKVTLNRVASSRFPNTICEVVYEQRWDKRRRRYVGAFAWTELDHLPKPQLRQWQKAWQAAETVYDNPQTVRLKGALFYHAAYIKPRWARQKQRVKRIGSHIFYQ